jgi:hypothetical protein
VIDDRLTRILERCRAELYPEMNAAMVADAAGIQSRNQFSDNRDPAQREMRELVKAEVTRQIAGLETPR